MADTSNREEAVDLFASAFAEWDRRYREDPGSFWTDVEHLVGNDPTSYGQAAAVYFAALLDELAPEPPAETPSS